MAKKKSNPEVKGSIWINTSNGMIIGPGKANLLQKIEETGSISAAARSMKMSYRQAWYHIATMNKNAGTPLVIKSTGGSGGGGADITTEGKKVLKQYNAICKRFQTFLRNESKKLKIA
jgi:molybdate transport system regulatory protein